VTVPRPEHSPQGDPCTLCRLAAARHRKRVRVQLRDRTEYMREYNAHRSAKRAKRPTPPRPRKLPPGKPIIAIDGEGYTLKNGQHRYVYLAACDENGLVAELRDPRGIKFDAFANWLIDKLPAHALVVAFSFGYDRTKLVESLSTAAIWGLHRPEERIGKRGPRPCRIGNAWRVNLVGSCFSIKRVPDARHQRVWDLFKFFQSSFVVALEKWNIGTPRERSQIARMKQKRGAFRGIRSEEQRYCQSECVLLAKLAAALLAAHEAEDLKLTAFHGPGSTASIILKSCGAEEQNAPIPDENAIQSAYFGGRFECSHLGPIPAPIYCYDIASAYPYALAQLPCFAHGRWQWVKHWAGQPWSCIRYRIHWAAPYAWGPLPYRRTNGNILYPIATEGGWAWDAEVKEAQLLHKGVETLGAWVWRSRCKHDPPFKARIVDLFERRRAWGKASRGIVLKLGLNSMYGKSAQQVGSARYRCMVRAGLITSLTRAMLLQAVRNAKDPWNILELATDSVLSREPLTLPASPLGPLGAWEEKTWNGGAFLMQPGLRFAIDREAEIGRTAARGLGVRTLHRNRALVQRAWARAPMAPVTIQQPSMFHGAKSSTRRVTGELWPDGSTGWRYVRDETYGRWLVPERRVHTYAPAPKRCELLQDFRLMPWELDDGIESAAYGEADPSPLGEALSRARDVEREQPDAEMNAPV
jgi:hypothetical protein